MSNATHDPRLVGDFLHLFSNNGFSKKFASLIFTLTFPNGKCNQRIRFPRAQNTPITSFAPYEQGVESQSHVSHLTSHISHLTSHVLRLTSYVLRLQSSALHLHSKVLIRSSFLIPRLTSQLYGTRLPSYMVQSHNCSSQTAFNLVLNDIIFLATSEHTTRFSMNICTLREKKLLEIHSIFNLLTHWYTY
jgi:hypothetical protein